MQGPLAARPSPQTAHHSPQAGPLRTRSFCTSRDASRAAPPCCSSTCGRHRPAPPTSALPSRPSAADSFSSRTCARTSRSPSWRKGCPSCCCAARCFEERASGQHIEANPIGRRVDRTSCKAVRFRSSLSRRTRSPQRALHSELCMGSRWRGPTLRATTSLRRRLVIALIAGGRCTCACRAVVWTRRVGHHRQERSPTSLALRCSPHSDRTSCVWCGDCVAGCVTWERGNQCHASIRHDATTWHFRAHVL